MAAVVGGRRGCIAASVLPLSFSRSLAHERWCTRVCAGGMLPAIRAGRAAQSARRASSRHPSSSSPRARERPWRERHGHLPDAFFIHAYGCLRGAHAWARARRDPDRGRGANISNRASTKAGSADTLVAAVAAVAAASHPRACAYARAQVEGKPAYDRLHPARAALRPPLA